MPFVLTVFMYRMYAGGNFRRGLQAEDIDDQRRGSGGASVGHRWTGEPAAAAAGCAGVVGVGAGVGSVIVVVVVDAGVVSVMVVVLVVVGACGWVVLVLIVFFVVFDVGVGVVGIGIYE